MAKKILLISILLVTTFSLMAQWTCETIDPEFDNATKVAYNTDNNKAQLIMVEYQTIFTYINWAYFTLGYMYDLDVLKIGEDDELTEMYDYEMGKTGNIPLFLAAYSNYICPEGDYCIVYSFEFSFKVGDNYKRYKFYAEEIDNFDFDNDFMISYNYDKEYGRGYYRVEWPSKEFWKDFKTASTMKIRIKHDANSDYQYYEFNMSGSTNAFNHVTTNHQIIWPEERIEAFIKK